MKNKYYYQFQVNGLTFIGLLNSNYELTYLNIEERSNYENLIEIPVNKIVLEQMELYFAGKLKEFTFDYHLEGTNFQKQIWNALIKVPYGKTISYSELAKNAGNEKAVRAAASAVASNPIVIAIPCHRIIRNNGELGSYSAGGLKVKKMLIDIEKNG